jgi:hypothetical protein
VYVCAKASWKDAARSSRPAICIKLGYFMVAIPRGRFCLRARIMAGSDGKVSSAIDMPTRPIFANHLSLISISEANRLLNQCLVPAYPVLTAALSGLTSRLHLSAKDDLRRWTQKVFDSAFGLCHRFSRVPAKLALKFPNPATLGQIGVQAGFWQLPPKTQSGFVLCAPPIVNVELESRIGGKDFGDFAEALGHRSRRQ